MVLSQINSTICMILGDSNINSNYKIYISNIIFLINYNYDKEKGCLNDNIRYSIRLKPAARNNHSQ